ncbi:Armadillo-type fold [Phytophthora cactorum]|nr:Armadillo-type fold [Phytophthora cactorum]
MLLFANQNVQGVRAADCSWAPRAQADRAARRGLQSAEISTNAELHEKMVSKGVVKALLTLILQSSDPEALRLACLCMANVASCPASRVRIVEDGVLPPLVKFFKDEENENDAVAKQYVAMTIGNLAASPRTMKKSYS